MALKSSLKILLKVLLWLSALVLLVVVLIYAIRAFAARTGPALRAEHRVHFEHEFVASMEAATDWQDYLSIEQQLFADLQHSVIEGDEKKLSLSRYRRGGMANPARYGHDWNRSYVMLPEKQLGVAVLIHGLSDSPYSMKATADLLRDQGYVAIVPRMPGHGFAVGGLRDAHWEDWVAAVHVAVRYADQLRAPGQPLILSGYSNGGLLAVLYATDCRSEASLPCPQGLVLLSPALKVTAFARLGDWHQLVSWTPWFEKFQYDSVLPEIDPFKFTSFPKNSGWEIYQMSQHLEKRLRTASKTGAMAEFPPVLTFQSVVDDTVDTAAVLERLYDRLPANGSELVVYDINRSDLMLALFGKEVDDPLAIIERPNPLNYSLTAVINENGDSNRVKAVELPAGELAVQTRSLDLSWPPGVYSLSHIAVPFRPDDVVYGSAPAIQGKEKMLRLGDVAPRGERKLLALSPNYFLRLRHNPFMAYQRQRIQGWLAETIEAAPDR